jgi:hypothetical protein
VSLALDSWHSSLQLHNGDLNELHVARGYRLTNGKRVP